MRVHSLVRSALNGSSEAPAIIFVHGLGGSPSETWAKMFDAFRTDPTFDSYALDCYKYPTRLISFPFLTKLPTLTDIADGLKTFLDEQHPQRREIFLVAHSLGGLVARQYVISQLKAAMPVRVKRLALIAVPCTGSSLANIAKYVSFRHQQLLSLTKDNNSLIELNIDWEELHVERDLSVRYIIAGCDRAVSPESALPFIGQTNKSMLIEEDHKSIVRPAGHRDIRYTTVRNFLLPTSSCNNEGKESGNDQPLATPRLRPDPLFDMYMPEHSTYYIERTFDSVLSATLNTCNVWLVGESGVGKTAALRKAVYQNGWYLNQVTLGAYVAQDAREIFRAMCVELAALARIDEVPGSMASTAELFAFAKNVLRSFPSDQIVANLIEEIPVGVEQLASFADLLAQFLVSLASEVELYGRHRFALSSLMDLRNAESQMASKTREQVQVIVADHWGSSESGRLIVLLQTALGVDLSDADQNAISAAAAGSPRFIKQVFRHWRADVGKRRGVDEIIALVIAEQTR